jgi:hypothetical protein
MANPEHLEMLKQGVDVWNEWRKENPTVKPDLTFADLRQKSFDTINLSNSALSHGNFEYVSLTDAKILGADLSNANLSRADLQYSDFSGADLSGAYLINSSLNHSKFINADLTDSNLSDSNFSFADLTGSNLFYANLSRVEFFETRISNTTVGFTVFASVDFRQVIGLEKVKHSGPSSVSIDTFIMSEEEIPEVFLRGAGVPDNFIKYMSSLTSKAFDYYSCFISYSSRDQVFVEQIYDNFQNRGVRCWYAPEDMKIGDKIRDRIDQSIRVHDKSLLVLSGNSIDSGWVEDEVEAAYEQEQKRNTTVLFPIRIDSSVMITEKAWASKLRRSRHIGDFTKWKDHDSYQKAFERLLKDLKAES